jgi:hypothetical protein
VEFTSILIYLFQHFIWKCSRAPYDSFLSFPYHFRLEICIVRFFSREAWVEANQQNATLCSSASRFQSGHAVQSRNNNCAKLTLQRFSNTHFPRLNGNRWQHCTALSGSEQKRFAAMKSDSEDLGWRLPSTPCYDWLLNFSAKDKRRKKRILFNCDLTSTHS